MSGSNGGKDQPNTNLTEVRRNWQEQEDFSIAYAMQNKEFEHHYDSNRVERRTMQTDTQISRGQQQLEDQFAAEYFEQLRLDREKDDERLAAELQRQLDAEEANRRIRSLQDDEEIARRLQAVESSQTKKPAAAHCADLRFKFPSEVPSYLADMVQKAYDSHTPLHLPCDVSFEQLKALYSVLKEADSRLAQEVRDHELALELGRREKLNSSSSGTSSTTCNAKCSTNHVSPHIMHGMGKESRHLNANNCLSVNLVSNDEAYDDSFGINSVRTGRDSPSFLRSSPCPASSHRQLANHARPAGPQNFTAVGSNVGNHRFPSDGAIAGASSTTRYTNSSGVEVISRNAFR